MDDIKVKQQSFSDWRNDFHPTEIESIDIIKNEPLVNERYKFIGPGKGKKPRDEDMTKNKGEKIGVDYSKLIQAKADKDKEVVSASYEADLENLIVEILEGDIEAMYEHGFSHQEIIEFYDVEDEFLEEGLVSGAIAGAKIIAKVAPKVAKYVAKRGAKDIKTVAKFVRNPKNWARANKDIDKVGNFVKELPARTYQSGKALRGATNKNILNPAKDITDKFKKSQEIANRAINIQKISATKTKLPKVDFKATVPPKLPKTSTNTTKLLKGTKDKVTKGMAPKEIRSKGMNLLAKLQGKTQKQQQAKELTSRMKNAIDKSKKATTYSGRVDAAKKLPDPQSAVVKGGSTAVKTTTLPTTKTTVVSSPKAKLTKVKSPTKTQTIDVKASPVGKGSKATQSKIKNAKEWMALNKRASVPSDVVTGNPNPPKFTGGKGSLKPKVTVSKDKLLSKVTTGVSAAAGLTAGVKTGQKIGKPNENKTISDTEKKKTDPSKNPIIKDKEEERLSKIKSNTEKYEKKRKAKYKYGTSGSHLSPLEQEMAN